MSQPSNLVGTPVSKATIDQLYARAGLLSTTNYQDDVALLYKAQGHNAFTRLSSFVSLTDSLLAKTLGANIDWDLAQKWALSNGSVSNHPGNGTINSSMNSTKQGENLPSYGIGGLGELGIRPMPGITSVNVTYAGKAGSIRQAEIKFRCHNMAQLDVIDVLYFRFGFSMLLEWGNTVYPISKNKLELQNHQMDIFKAGWTKEKVLRELAKNRRTSHGNYDGILGLVTNYNWAATPDGGYDCTLNLVGIGSVIESIKINGNQNWPTPHLDFRPTNPALPGYQSKKYDANYITSTPADTNWINSSLAKTLKNINDAILKEQSQAAIASEIDSLFRTGLNAAGTGVDGWSKGFNAGYMAGTAQVSDIDFTKVYTGHRESFKGADNAQLDYAYVPLSLILAAINNSCIAYDYDTRKTTPLFYIDFNPDTNFCFRLPDQISVDPSVCLLSSSDPTGAEYQAWLKARGIEISKITNPSPISTDDAGVMARLNNRVAGGVVAGYTDPGANTRGRMMNILVNLQYVIDLLDSMSAADQNSSVALSGFLTNLLSGIADVTGNINNFTVTYDDEANTIRLIDDQLVLNKQSANFGTIPVFGLSSIVRSLSLTTEASSQIGSMLAIEAMAAERTPTSDGRDASAFNALNSKLRDRLITERVREINETTPSESLLERAQAFVSYRSSLYKDGIINAELAFANKTFYQECFNTIKNGLDPVTKKPTSVTARGILPVALNMTMNGISNFQIWEGFVIPYDRLPSQYRNGTEVKVGFIVNGITHQITNQSWTTNIKAQMMNLPDSTATAANAITARTFAKPAGSAGATRGGGRGLVIPFDPAPFVTAKDNNPFDLVANTATQGFRGVVSYKTYTHTDGSLHNFLVFDTIQNGLRAGFINKSSYFTKYGLRTINEIANRVLAGSDLALINTFAGHYVVAMRKELGDKTLSVNTQLTFRGVAETDPKNIKMFKALCRAIILWEGGFKINGQQKNALIDSFTPAILK